jgi:NhaP-type Na+/H+ or K+/H+ antiporter/CRP-like cAMP-binding protein
LAFLFGALISATDPVAVVALLRDVSSRKRLETLLEGESLFNDGTAIVLFTLCFSILLSTEAVALNWLGIGFELLWTVLLGALVGWCGGRTVMRLVGRIYNDPLIETTLSIASAYLVYYIAEQLLHASGVVAVVVFGLLLAGKERARFSPEALDFLHHFWSMLAHVANTLIFLIVGLVIADRIELTDQQSWWLLAELYLGLLLIRAATIGLLLPLLKRLGLGLSWDKALVLSWGALRGAVALALALALMVDHHPQVSDSTGGQVLFLTAGIVVLTILINGSTMAWLFTWLGLDRLPPAKQAMIDRAEQLIHQQMKARLPEFKQRSLTQLADWQAIEASALGAVVAEQSGEALSPQSNAALATELRRRLLEQERCSYWQQYRDGFLGRRAVSRLIEAVDQALDGEPVIHPRPQLQRYWHASKPVEWMHRWPLLQGYANRAAYRHLILGYDMARGFVQAQNAALAHIDEVQLQKRAARKARAELIQNKRDTYAMLQQLRENFPELAATAERYSAQRTLLVQKKAMIKQLREQALLDPAEFERMNDRINQQLQARHHSNVAEAALPDSAELIRTSPWAAGLPDAVVAELIEASEQRIYQPQELIIAHEEQHQALIIVVRGVVERLNISAIDAHEEVMDLLGPGCYAGFSSLFEAEHHVALRASTPVNLLWIPADVLKRIMARQPQLKQALLKMVRQQLFNAL